LKNLGDQDQGSLAVCGDLIIGPNHPTGIGLDQGRTEEPQEKKPPNLPSSVAWESLFNLEEEMSADSKDLWRHLGLALEDGSQNLVASLDQFFLVLFRILPLSELLGVHLNSRGNNGSLEGCGKAMDNTDER